jgi:hypothetical protein
MIRASPNSAQFGSLECRGPHTCQEYIFLNPLQGDFCIFNCSRFRSSSQAGSSPTPTTFLLLPLRERARPPSSSASAILQINAHCSFNSTLNPTIMDDTERRTAKRSRFDQTEPEPRRSRFDRRSRSPVARKPDSTRDRSPLNRGTDSATPETKKSPVDAAAAAGLFSSSIVAPTVWMLISDNSYRRRQDQCATPGEKRHPTRRCSPH